MAAIKRRPDRAIFYARNIALNLCPSWFFRRRLAGILREAGERGDLVDRVNYYNKLRSYIEIPNGSRRICNIPLKKTLYYYDFKESSRYFHNDLRVKYLFRDVAFVAGVPSFAKSRPIRQDNTNNLLMKLAKFRHFYLPKDTVPFADKMPVAVWRGGDHNLKRIALVRRYRDNPLCDVGYTQVKRAEPQYSPFLRPQQQMAFKYIISIEGNDVASNLKWIMASNSLCLMPEPSCETWFMEGRLQAGRHYVRLAPDFDDLEDKILYYERHPDEALAIIRNANAYVSQFLDERRERIISILVMYKYFVATRQVEPEPAVRKLIGF